MEPTKIAISYIRFSSKIQAQGHSLERQTETAAEFAAQHGLTLDTSLSFRDLGVSAYDRSNVEKGALGLFLKAVQAGKVPRGATLIVESLDRLSRAQVLDALAVFIEILNAGITIATTMDRQIYSRESVGSNFGQLIVSLGIMQRANDESETKSDRVSKVWAKKKKKALELGTPMTRKSPHWIHADEKRKYTLIPERVEVLHKMLDMAERGVGNHTIIKTLHAEKIPAWSSSGKWEPSYIQKIMRSPALYGGIDIDGEIIQMYPPVIEKARFDYINALRSNRATTKNTNRKGLGVTNLFSGLLKCAYCGSPMNISGYKERRAGYERKYVACHGARTGKTACKMKMWFLDELEPSLLFWLTSIDYASLMNVGVQTDLQAEQMALAALEANVKDAASRVERTMIAIEEGATTMVPRLKQHEAEVKRLTELANTQRQKVAALTQQDGNSASRMKGLIALFKALKNTTDDVQRRLLREQLSAGIASTVARIVLFPAGRKVTGEKSDRFADVYFKNGATRRIEVGEC